MFVIHYENFIYVKVGGCKEGSVYLKQFGWHKNDIKDRFAGMKEEYIIHFVLDGQGFFERKGKKHTVSKKQAFLITPAEYTVYYGDKSNLWEYFWIGIDGSDVLKYLEKTGIFDSESHVIDLQNTTQLEILFKQMVENSQADKASYYFSGMMFLILNELLICSKNRNEKMLDSKDSITLAINYITHNFNKELSINKMSRALCTSRTSLYKLFMQTFGMSPQKYILEYKLTKARLLIVETNIPLKLIAVDCGFENYSNFSRTFKNKFKSSPQSLRRYGKINYIGKKA